MLGVPLAVLGSATGPCDDPKAWALVLLAALSGCTALPTLRQRLAPEAPESGRGVRWLGVVVMAYGFWWIITTVLSVGIAQSVVGNFGRGLGLLVVLAATLMFPLVRSECRSPDAIRTLIDAALLGSIPVCLLAFGQAIGWDPLPQAWDPAVKSLTIRSTFGQHIVLGSYLVAIIPLTMARLVWAWNAPDAARRGARVDFGSLAFGVIWVAGAIALAVLATRWDVACGLVVLWGIVGAIASAAVVGRRGMTLFAWTPTVAVLLASQILVVVLSRARGAFLGMVAGMAVTAFLLLARRRAWKTLGSAAVTLLVLALLLGLLNLPRSPLEYLRSMTLLSRLSHIADVRPGSPGWCRLQVWRGTIDGWQHQLRGEVVIPGRSPFVRSVVGYGLETQLVTLDLLTLPRLGALRARGEGWQARYLVDRAHNVLLDHLVTGGLVAVLLWILTIGLVLAIGAARARVAPTTAEFVVRTGALGTIVAHVVESQVGIVTPMPLVLFWVAAALCTLPPWSELRARSAAPVPRRAWWLRVGAPVAVAVLLVAWLETSWLFGSVAYAEGVLSVIAGRLDEAYQKFQRSRSLVPWLALPAEAMAETALRMAGRESDPSRRLDVLRDADRTLAALRGKVTGATYWRLSAQVAFAEVRSGDSSKVGASLEAFDQAARFRPGNAQLLAQWAWALLEARDPVRARATAVQAVNAAGEGRDAWLGWAILARAARELGDEAAAREASSRARGLAPAEARRILDALIP